MCGYCLVVAAPQNKIKKNVEKLWGVRYSGLAVQSGGVRR